ncbi:MAG: pyridinium-3,5-biscarboxylic acid mononucleotide sulfurtransferase [Actinomycetota bacterium]|nr:pyridinium-3,5-biscarboxylic acid mononucleotide sulfurtransferase [Actinomycetota bacterium]
MQLTVGFDLDMTLIDSRPGVHACTSQLSAELGVFIDADLVVSRLGPPLESELGEWMPEAAVPAAADRFRELMAESGAANCLALPGAADAVRAIRASGGRVVVVTAKSAALAEISLAAVGIEVDAIHGWLWSEGKGTALRDEGASVYVGDHPHDVLGARFAGAHSVGVRTGGTTPVDADVLLDDLTSFPQWYAEHLLDVRLEALSARLRELGSVLVAFSGGADSAFLLAAAVRALGADKVVAATAVSPSLATAELPAAVQYAASLDVRHVTPETNEIDRPGYVANDGNRCFHCKATLLDTLRPLAESLGLAHVATGTNADDAVAGFRPGIRAAAERGAATPLLDAGLTKAQVREASRRWALVTADKPALACLASRIAYGVQVTPSRLARVDRAETALRALLGDVVSDLRVRDLGDGAARIELDPVALDACDQRAIDAVLAEGFTTATATTYRTGSLNDALA